MESWRMEWKLEIKHLLKNLKIGYGLSPRSPTFPPQSFYFSINLQHLFYLNPSIFFTYRLILWSLLLVVLKLDSYIISFIICELMLVFCFVFLFSDDYLRWWLRLSSYLHIFKWWCEMWNCATSDFLWNIY